MGQSISSPVPSSGRFDHPWSSSRLNAYFRNSVLVHQVERSGFTAEYPVAVTIGSGKVGQSYAVRMGDALMQSPLSWFAQSGRWGMSPGYEREGAPDFDRRITLECLNCHAGALTSTAETPQPITCERCHAPSSTHFLNPAKLPAAARDRICETCHLQGEARILNPGSDWSSPNPSFTVYVSSRSGGALKVVSQVEQLALSRCSQQSGGALWCGTCHSPHGPKKDVNQVCAGCHSGGLSAVHVPSATDCTSCHMTRQPTPEVAHTTYTDHRIRRTPPSQPAVSTVAEAGGTLLAWREAPPPYAERNLGLAYIYAGQRDQSAEWMQKGFALLIHSKARDAVACSALASVLLQKQRPQEAATLFMEAARLQPGAAEHLHNLAVALLSSGRRQEAMEKLEAATRLDPSYEPAWLLLARLYGESGDRERRAQVIQRHLQRMPQNLTFRIVQQQDIRLSQEQSR